MNLTEIPQTKEYKFKGRVVNMRVDTCTLPNGKTATREVVEHTGGVCILPLSSDGKIYFVKQFRYPFLTETLEIPAGKLELNEEPFEAGKRELSEEIGATCENYLSLGKMLPSPGYCGEIIHMYLANGLNFGNSHPDEDEFLEVYSMPVEDAVKMVISGEIIDAKTQIAILKLDAMKTRGLI